MNYPIFSIAPEYINDGTGNSPQCPSLPYQCNPVPIQVNVSSYVNEPFSIQKNVSTTTSEVTAPTSNQFDRVYPVQPSNIGVQQQQSMYFGTSPVSNVPQMYGNNVINTQQQQVQPPIPYNQQPTPQTIPYGQQPASQTMPYSSQSQYLPNYMPSMPLQGCTPNGGISVNQSNMSKYLPPSEQQKMKVQCPACHTLLCAPLGVSQFLCICGQLLQNPPSLSSSYVPPQYSRK